jgi:hypothetical protein
VFVHPVFGTSGKIFVFIPHLALKCLSFRVVKLLPLGGANEPDQPKVGSFATLHIQRQSRPPKRPIRRYLFPWICFPENTQATSKQLFGSGLAARRATVGRQGWMKAAGAFFGRPRELRTRHNMATDISESE